MKPRTLLLSFLSLALCFLLTIPAQSAQPDDAAYRQLTMDANNLVEVVWNRATTTPSFIRGDFRQTIAQQQSFADAESAAMFWVERYATLLAIEVPAQELSVEKVETDALGYTHVRFDQSYQGVPVFNAGVNIHLSGDAYHLAALSNSFVPEIALASVVPTFPLTQAITLAQRALPNGVLATDPLLTVYVDQRDLAPQAHLTWHVELWDAQKLLDNVYVIDAHSGLLLDVWNRVYDARNREIYDAQNKEEFGGTLVRKEGDGPTGDIDADNAYDYAGNTYDYYMATFGRDSFDGNGATMKATVHFGQNYLNAGYSSLIKQIIYGDGMVSKDVTGHEWSHGVINSTANLEYRWQSGALNESFADIFGAMIDREDWLIGEDLPEAILRGHPAIRSMADPAALGQPGHTDDWDARCDDHEGVHINSGITNKVYYNIAEAIGKEKAEQIFYRTLTVYLQPTSSLQDARAAALQAAQDLYGAGSAEETAVDAGFAAVGLTADWNPPVNECSCAVTVALDQAVAAADRMSALNTIATLYRLRDELLNSSALGEQYRALYEQHSGRATQLLLSNPTLLGQSSSILLTVTPGVEGLLNHATQPDDHRLSEDMVAQMQTFLTELAAADRAANPEAPMAAMIETEMAKINWDALVGMTVAEAWEYLNNPPAMQYKLYLPLIQ